MAFTDENQLIENNTADLLRLAVFSVVL